MFDQFSDGYCPQCLLDSKRTDMILNTDDFWECPTCQLQARSGGGAFVILRIRGKGSLKDTKASQCVSGWFLRKAKNDDLRSPDSFPVKSEAELREFLAKVVQTKSWGEFT